MSRVFFGDDSESVEAVDARNGRALWHFNTGQEFRAAPMTYAVDGLQYVAIAAPCTWPLASSRSPCHSQTA